MVTRGESEKAEQHESRLQSQSSHGKLFQRFYSDPGTMPECRSFDETSSKSPRERIDENIASSINSTIGKAMRNIDTSEMSSSETANENPGKNGCNSLKSSETLISEKVVKKINVGKENSLLSSDSDYSGTDGGLASIKELRDKTQAISGIGKLQNNNYKRHVSFDSGFLSSPEFENNEDTDSEDIHRPTTYGRRVSWADELVSVRMYEKDRKRSLLSFLKKPKLSFKKETTI